jgi:hypothetical protein
MDFLSDTPCGAFTCSYQRQNSGLWHCAHDLMDLHGSFCHCHRQDIGAHDTDIELSIVKTHIVRLTSNAESDHLNTGT